MYTNAWAPVIDNRCGYYDEPHSLTVEMQEDAFTWLDRWLL